MISVRIFKFFLLAYLFLCINLKITVIFSFENKNFEKEFDKYKEKEEARHLDPILLNINVLKKQKEILKQLKLHLVELKNIANLFYSPIYSYFKKNKSIHQSSNFNIKVFSQGLEDGQKSIRILDLASKDKISTDPFPKDKRFNGGKIILKVNDRSFVLEFKNVTLKDIHSEFSKQEKENYYQIDFLSIDAENKENILIIESAKSGVKNKLELSGDIAFLKELGLIKNSAGLPKKEEEKKDLNEIQDQNRKNQENEDEDKKISIKNYYPVNGKIEIEDGILKVFPDSKAESENFIEVINPENISYIEFFVKKDTASKEEKEEKKENLDDKNKDKLDIGSIEELVIGNVDFKTGFLKKYLKYPILEEEKLPDKENEDKKIKSLLINFFDENDLVIFNRNIHLIKENYLESINTENWTKVQFNLDHLDFKKKKVKKIYFFNLLQNYSYLLKDLNIFYKKKQVTKKKDEAKDNLRQDSYNYINVAKDARFIIDNIEFKRETNKIEDVLPGALLELYSTNKKPELIKIEKDIENILSLFSKFAKQYNGLILFLSNITDPLRQKDDEDRKLFLARMSLKDFNQREEEFSKKSREDKNYEILSGLAYRGYMQYEFFLKSLKDKIQRVVLYSPYDTKVEKAVKFLVQIGLNSFSEDSSVGDYISFDEDKLASSLKRWFNEVEDLFGYKINKNSIVKDGGIGVQLVQLIDFYVKTTIKSEKGQYQVGIIESKERILENDLRNLEKKYQSMNKKISTRIDKFSYDLEKAEALQEELKRKETFLMNTLKGTDGK